MKPSQIKVKVGEDVNGKPVYGWEETNQAPKVSHMVFYGVFATVSDTIIFN
jgi:hypothetical protein